MEMTQILSLLTWCHFVAALKTKGGGYHLALSDRYPSGTFRTSQTSTTRCSSICTDTPGCNGFAYNDAGYRCKIYSEFSSPLHYISKQLEKVFFRSNDDDGVVIKSPIEASWPQGSEWCENQGGKLYFPPNQQKALGVMLGFQLSGFYAGFESDLGGFKDTDGNPIADPYWYESEPQENMTKGYINSVGAMVAVTGEEPNDIICLFTDFRFGSQPNATQFDLIPSLNDSAAESGSSIPTSSDPSSSSSSVSPLPSSPTYLSSLSSLSSSVPSTLPSSVPLENSSYTKRWPTRS